MATIKDVAERAGITVTTVSRVLNNRGYISDKTRKKVYQAMKELDYRPNAIARALAQNQTNSIGIIVPSLLHPFFAVSINYFESYAAQHGFKIMICNSQRNIEKEMEYFDMLRSNKVAGIILCTRSGEVEKYLGYSFPVVTFERSISNQIPAVLCDNYLGGVLATKHLLESGCTHPAMLNGSLHVRLPADDRAKAFIDICNAANVHPLIFTTNEEQFDNRRYRPEIDTLIEENPEIDGIFASSDVIAAQAIQACYKKGIRIPEDVKLVGFDDIEIATLTTPTLTTIHQPIELMCKYAIEIILQKMKGEVVPIRTVLPVTLVQRESTATTP
jgi:LacI family sucrose operon transcriptional repressor